MEEEIKKPEKPPEEDFKDKYLRLLAEMENMRKRLQKEKEETIRYAIENTIADFLNPLDHLEQALKHADKAPEEVKNWALGFNMILLQFRDILHNYGIVAFHSQGTFFDPLLHEALEIVETLESPDGLILEEFAKGYKSPQRTLRPAHVKVAKHPKNQGEPHEQKEE